MSNAPLETAVRIGAVALIAVAVGLIHAYGFNLGLL